MIIMHLFPYVTKILQISASVQLLYYFQQMYTEGNKVFPQNSQYGMNKLPCCSRMVYTSCEDSQLMFLKIIMDNDSV